MASPRPTPLRHHSYSSYSTSRTSLDAASPALSPPSRSPSLRLSQMSHRQSFSESLRGLPPSPRAHRQPSLSQLYLQELIDNPPARNAADPAFQGRDWRTIEVGELVEAKDLVFVDGSMSIEDATNLLISSSAPVLLIRDPKSPNSAISTFDYTDLNAYLLLAVGLVQPDEAHVSSYRELANKARAGTIPPVADVKDFNRRELLVKLPQSANLLKAIEKFGEGVHRIVITKQGTDEDIGVLSQTRLVNFLWENGRAFPVIEDLFFKSIRELGIGSHNVVSINGDSPLTEALTLLLTTGVSSLAVLDSSSNVIGNISTADVKLLTKSSSLPLLHNTCIHFISVILSTRGMNDGKDSFPVFHVHPQSTLAHTVAKLIATKSHRMWMTEPASPLSSGPPTPSSHPATLAPISSHSHSSIHPLPSPGLKSSPSPATTASSGATQVPTPSPTPPSVVPHLPSLPGPQHTPPSSAHGISTHTGPSVSSSSLPGARLSGHLVGLVSLTDILNLFAKASGLHPGDPDKTRRERRRSSASSGMSGTALRRSVDLGRSADLGVGGVAGVNGRPRSRGG